MPTRLPDLVRHPAIGWAASLASVLSSMTLLLFLVQDFYGLPLNERMKIGPDTKIGVINPDTGCYRWRLPEKYNRSINHTRAIVLEDGRPLSRVMHVAEVETRRGSHYMVRGAVVRFGAVDASDVRKNGRKYEIIVPKPIREEWVLAASLLLALTLPLANRSLTNPLRSLGKRIDCVPTWLIAILAMAAVSTDLIVHPERTHGAFLVKGLPESDARGWFDFATRLHDGHTVTDGFANQRPLYAVVLAAAMGLFGPSLLAAKGLNVLFAGLGAAGVFALGKALRNSWAGLASAVFLCLSYDHLRQWHAVQTENMGLAFAVLATVVLIWAVDRRKFWAVGLAGAIAGLGNLAAGHLLLALPLMAGLLAALLLRGRGDRLRYALMLMAFIVGSAITLLPWMGIQKYRHGVFTLSLNSAELLAGAADPDTGKLTGAIHSEADAKGFTEKRWRERYNYYIERYRRDVAADPLRYLKHVLYQSWASLEYLEMDDALLRTLLAITLLGAGLVISGRWQAPQPLILALAALYLVTDKDVILPGWSLLVLSVGLVLTGKRREQWLPLTVLLLTIVGAMLLNGLSGNVATRRFWLVMDWALVLPALAGIGGWLQWLSLGLAKVPVLNCGMKKEFTAGEEGQQSAPLVDQSLRFAPWVCFPALVLCLVACATVLFRMAGGPRVVFDPVKISSLSSTREAVAGEQPLLLYFDDQVIHLARGEDVAHWMPQYTPAERPRWLALPRVILPNGTLGVRVVFEKLSARRDSAFPRWQPARCLAKVRSETDPLTRTPVSIYQVKDLQVLTDW